MKKEQVQSAKDRLRTKAEKELNTRGNSVPEDKDYARLYHELSVYQIELELQNKELAEARDSAERLADKYTELYDFAPAGYFSLSRDGKIVELNLSASSLIGKERNLLNKSIFEHFITLETRQEFRDFFAKLSETSRSESCEVQLQNGKYLSLTGVNLDGQRLLTATDITLLRTTLKEKEELYNDLSRTRKKLDLALRKASIGNWELDKTTNNFYFDSGMAEIIDLPHENSPIELFDFEKLIHEQDIGRVRKEIASSLEKDTPIDTVFRIVKKNGQVRYINFKGLTSYDEKADINKLTGVGIDITRLHEASEKSLIKLNEELTRSNNELEQFANVASHDLQEPLRMVTSFIQLLDAQYGDSLDEKAHEYINYAAQGAKRMHDLLNSLLSYSRIQTRGASFVPVDLNDVVRIVSENLRIYISEKKATIEKDDLPVVTGDYNQLIQLIQNLVENGIKFSDGKPGIRISSKKSNGYHIISISDNGIGIEKAYHEKIFGIFQKLHNRDDYPGTGIGLAVCKSVVQRHGGSIWLKSEQGKGSTFYFSIPVSPLKPEY